MRALALAALLALTACGGDDPSYSDLYQLTGTELSCPTADSVEEFGISPSYRGYDEMGICRWYCREGETLILRFLRHGPPVTGPGSYWVFDDAFTAPCGYPG